ncbi:MAG TPA: PAS domain S-box protein, partial [Candidatus Paceibacterota bacterium]|nr:PAS domain S-box protein [Candidatus Paceibacterota bacterium]
MNKPLRALIIEDSEQDTRLLLRELAHGGYSTTSQRVETAEALRTALSKKDWDIVFCDFSLPKFSGQEALAMVRKEEDDLPFIFVSGTIGEEVAVEAMKSGAHDYVMKDNLVRLVPAVQRELREAEEHRERRRAEEAMRNSENKYRHLFESLSDAAFLIEKESDRIIDTNRQAEVLLGLPREKILGLNREQVFRAANGGSDIFALSGGLPAPQCEALVTRAGTEKLIPVFASFSEVEIHGHKLLLVLARDITERKRAEEQLRKLSLAVEQSPTSILITDSAGNIEYVNPKFTKVTGYSLEEVRGKNPRFLKSGKMPPDFYRELWETITSGNEWHGELQNKRKDGAFYWEYVSISPVVDSSGRITHYVAVKEDVTEKKLLEARFLRAQRLESIGELAGGIAHDLNNILTPVLMGAAMLRHTINSEEGLSLVSTIETSARRGSDIVKQVLTFARGVQGDRVLLHPEKLVKEMGKIIQETFPKSIQLKMEISGNLWTVLGDATQLHQILMNLTVNARDAMLNGGVLVLGAENVTLDEA